MKHHAVDEKGLALAVVAALLLLGALIPVTLWLDAKVDQKRPMYADIDSMALLQWGVFTDSGAAEPVDMVEGDSVKVGRTAFTLSEGVVSLEVTATAEGYCITATNDHGDVADERCEDGATDPRKAG